MARSFCIGASRAYAFWQSGGVGVDNGENLLRVEMRSGRLRTVVTVELLDVVSVAVLMGLVVDDGGSAGADVEEESCGKCTGC